MNFKPNPHRPVARKGRRAPHGKGQNRYSPTVELIEGQTAEDLVRPLLPVGKAAGRPASHFA